MSRHAPAYPVPPDLPEPAPPVSRRSWGKVPYEERFRRQRKDLLDAAAALAAERGVAGTTISAITSKAGVAKRVFYEHFDDKEACFVELVRQLGADHLRSAVAAAQQREGSGPYETIRAVIASLVNVRLADPRLLAATKAGAERYSALAAVYAEHRGRIADLFVAVAARCGSTLAPETIHMAALLLISGVTDLGGELRKRRGAMDELTTICCLAFGLSAERA